MDPSDDRDVPLKTLLRWSETLAGIARTGLGFTQSLYEKERFEEILKVAADIRSEVDGENEDPDFAGGLVQEWMDTVGTGVPGYVTPKVAVGAAVGNDEGELLLIQRADSGIWLYPTGWCDVGYSAAEVVVKEVEEETGIIAEPVRLIAVLDGLRLGFTRVPLYSLLFYCRAVGGAAGPAPARDARRRLVHPRDAAPAAGWLGSLGRARLRRPERRAARRALRQRASTDVAGRIGNVVISVRIAESVDADLVAAVTSLLPQLSRSAPPPTADQLARIVADPATTLFVAEEAGTIVGSLTLAAFEILTGRRAWIEDVVTDATARGKGVASALITAAVHHAADLGARTVDLTSRPVREDANRLYLNLGFEQRVTNVYRRTLETPQTTRVLSGRASSAHGDDGGVERQPTGRAMEDGVAVAEDATVRGHQPVARRRSACPTSRRWAWSRWSEPAEPSKPASP